MRIETKCVCGETLLMEGTEARCKVGVSAFLHYHRDCKPRIVVDSERVTGDFHSCMEPGWDKVNAIPKYRKLDPVPPPLPTPEPRPCQSHGGTFNGELFNAQHQLHCPRCVVEFTKKHCVPPPFDRSSTDAQVWAKEFMRIWTGKMQANVQEVDEALMIGWFANAMCAQMDADHRKHAHEKQQIENLTRENAVLRHDSEKLNESGIVEIAAHNPRVAEFVRDLEKRVAKAEAGEAMAVLLSGMTAPLSRIMQAAGLTCGQDDDDSRLKVMLAHLSEQKVWRQDVENSSNRAEKAEQKAALHLTEMQRIDAALGQPHSGATLLESDLAEIARILALLDTRHDEVQSLMSQLAQYRDAQQPKQDTP